MSKEIKRVGRGGSWFFDAREEGRAAFRDWYVPRRRYIHHGFRPAFRLKRIKR